MSSSSPPPSHPSASTIAAMRWATERRSAADANDIDRITSEVMRLRAVLFALRTALLDNHPLPSVRLSPRDAAGMVLARVEELARQAPAAMQPRMMHLLVSWRDRFGFPHPNLRVAGLGTLPSRELESLSGIVASRQNGV